MSTFKIGKIERQGKTYFFVPMDPSFGRRDFEEQKKITLTLQKCASEKGFSGRIIPVWDADDGSLSYFVPPYLQAFVSQLDLIILKKHIKDEFECDLM